MTIKLANNAVSRLSSPITATDTTLSVSAGEGVRFPTLAADETFPITVVKSDGTLEIMRCTERAADLFTVVRAQEGTAPQEFAAGDRIELRLTSGALDEKIDQSLETVRKEKLDKSENLSDLDDAEEAVENLGLSSVAKQDSNNVFAGDNKFAKVPTVGNDPINALPGSSLNQIALTSDDDCNDLADGWYCWGADSVPENAPRA